MTGPFRGIRPSLPAGIREGGVVAIARRLDPRRVTAVADALLAGGVRAFELTLDEPEGEALEAISVAARHAEGSPLVVGAGTVLTIGAARRALDAGARFLVMPHTDFAFVGWAAEEAAPVLPGAFTPTEVLAGWRGGAAAVKLFPASVAGPAFVRELRGPFPEIPLVPSGGVTVDNAGEFVRAGATAVGVGSWLIGDGDPDGIRDRAARVVRAVADARA